MSSASSSFYKKHRPGPRRGVTATPNVRNVVKFGVSSESGSNTTLPQNFACKTQRK